MNSYKADPDAYRAMMALSNRVTAAAKETGLDPLLLELVKVRASQINGCAYCLKLHHRDAIALGEAPERLAVVAAWWESQYFTQEEQAALQLAEQVTRIDRPSWLTARGVDASEVLTDAQITAVMWVAVAINSWNRIAISSHYPAGPAS
jgi:AhpD family alkylhydroperoxidase